MTARRVRRMGVRAVFGLPALIGVATCGGLAAGLMGEGVWDMLAWGGLALPCIAIGPVMRGTRQVRLTNISDKC